MRKIDSIELAEAFLLKHGEKIVDRVGAEIDRIERNLRVSLLPLSSMIQQKIFFLLEKTSFLTTCRFGSALNYI